MFDDWGDALQPLLTGLVTGTLALWLSGRITRRRSGRDLAPGEVVVGVRSVTD